MDKNKFVIGIQARSGSTRLPGKCLNKILEWPLWFLAYRAARSTGISTYLLVPENDTDMLESFKGCGIEEKFIIQGSEKFPLDRFQKLIERVPEAKWIIRLTADCPFIPSRMILDMAYQCYNDELVFMYNELDGMDIQVASLSLFNCLKYLDVEHVFNMKKIKDNDLYTKYEMHLSVDTQEQYDHIKFLAGDEHE